MSSPVVRDGEILTRLDAAAARRRCAASLAELPAEAMKLSPGEPAIEFTCYEGDTGGTT
ncbi:MAG: hypothetical protein JO246_04550 [Frankiaceae bacterium]|nr:hypothetical protein [Frankiaceae bacterium]